MNELSAMSDECPPALLSYAVDRMAGERESTAICCKICGADTQLFDVVDFNKCCNFSLYPHGLAGIPVFYRSCRSCGFIFTTFFDAFTSEQWRAYVYNEAYAVVDPDYREIRPRRNVSEIEFLLSGKKTTTIGLDYGGGSGLTAKLLRANGWNYDACDPYGFTDLKQENIGKYNFCSSYEVFEHSPDPLATLLAITRLMASSGRLMILISTGIHDHQVSPGTRLSWWYAAPRNGHVSLYSRTALKELATRAGLSYVPLAGGTHLFVRDVSYQETRAWLLRLLGSKFLEKGRRALRIT